jgi:hypothetical protein
MSKYELNPWLKQRLFEKNLSIDRLGAQKTVLNKGTARLTRKITSRPTVVLNNPSSLPISKPFQTRQITNQTQPAKWKAMTLLLSRPGGPISPPDDRTHTSRSDFNRNTLEQLLARTTTNQPPPSVALPVKEPTAEVKQKPGLPIRKMVKGRITEVGEQKMKPVVTSHSENFISKNGLSSTTADKSLKAAGVNTVKENTNSKISLETPTEKVTPGTKVSVSESKEALMEPRNDSVESNKIQPVALINVPQTPLKPSGTAAVWVNSEVQAAASMKKEEGLNAATISPSPPEPFRKSQPAEAKLTPSQAVTFQKQPDVSNKGMSVALSGDKIANASKEAAINPVAAQAFAKTTAAPSTRGAGRMNENPSKKDVATTTGNVTGTNSATGAGLEISSQKIVSPSSDHPVFSPEVETPHTNERDQTAMSFSTAELAESPIRTDKTVSLFGPAFKNPEPGIRSENGPGPVTVLAGQHGALARLARPTVFRRMNLSLKPLIKRIFRRPLTSRDGSAQKAENPATNSAGLVPSTQPPAIIPSGHSDSVTKMPTDHDLPVETSAVSPVVPQDESPILEKSNTTETNSEPPESANLSGETAIPGLGAAEKPTVETRSSTLYLRNEPVGGFIGDNPIKGHIIGNSSGIEPVNSVGGIINLPGPGLLAPITRLKDVRKAPQLTLKRNTALKVQGQPERPIGRNQQRLENTVQHSLKHIAPLIRVQRSGPDAGIAGSKTTGKLDLPLVGPVNASLKNTPYNENPGIMKSTEIAGQTGPSYFSVGQPAVTYINREFSQEASGSTTDNKRETDKKKTDLKALAQEIYPYIKRQIMIERERMSNR